MKNKILWLLCCGILLFFSCGNSKEQEKTNRIIAAKQLIVAGDSILKSLDVKEIKVFVKKGTEYIRINDFNNWPEDIEVTINIVDIALPLLYIEVPYSESGDWENTYIHYFDKNGNLVAFMRKSSFFNGICIDGILREKTTLIYDEKFNLIDEEYELHDEEGKLIKDTSLCIFNYRFDYNIYKKIKETPMMSEISLKNKK